MKSLKEQFLSGNLRLCPRCHWKTSQDQFLYSRGRSHRVHYSFAFTLMLLFGIYRCKDIGSIIDSVIMSIYLILFMLWEETCICISLKRGGRISNFIYSSILYSTFPLSELLLYSTHHPFLYGWNAFKRLLNSEMVNFKFFQGILLWAPLPTHDCHCNMALLTHWC